MQFSCTWLCGWVLKKIRKWNQSTDLSTYPLDTLLSKEKTWKGLGFFDANWTSNFQLVGFYIFVSKCQLFELFNILVNCLTWYLPKSMHYYQDQLDFYSRFENFFGLSFYLDDFLFFCHACHGVFCCQIVDIFEFGNGSLFSLQLEIIWST